jgi:hypothetical protein
VRPERGLFLILCTRGRQRPNGSVVPGPESNFLFPHSVFLAAAVHIPPMWQPLDQIVFSSEQTAHRIPDTNQKVEPRTGYQINPRSGATGTKIFTSVERTF